MGSKDSNMLGGKSLSYESVWKLIEKKEWTQIQALNLSLRSAHWSDRICEQFIYMALARGMPKELLCEIAKGKEIVENTNVYCFLATRYTWTDQYELIHFLQKSEVSIEFLINSTPEKQAYFTSARANDMIRKYLKTRRTWMILWIRERVGMQLPISLVRETVDYFCIRQ